MEKMFNALLSCAHRGLHTGMARFIYAATTPTGFEGLSGDWHEDVKNKSDKNADKRMDFVTLAARESLKLQRDMVKADVETEIDKTMRDGGKTNTREDLKKEAYDFSEKVENRPEGQPRHGLQEILYKYFRNVLKKSEWMPADMDKKTFLRQEVNLSLYNLEKNGKRQNADGTPAEGAFNVDNLKAGATVEIKGGLLTITNPDGTVVVKDQPLRAGEVDPAVEAKEKLENDRKDTVKFLDGIKNNVGVSDASSFIKNIESGKTAVASAADAAAMKVIVKKIMDELPGLIINMEKGKPGISILVTGKGEAVKTLITEYGKSDIGKLSTDLSDELDALGNAPWEKAAPVPPPVPVSGAPSAPAPITAAPSAPKPVPSAPPTAPENPEVTKEKALIAKVVKDIESKVTAVNKPTAVEISDAKTGKKYPVEVTKTPEGKYIVGGTTTDGEDLVKIPGDLSKLVENAIKKNREGLATIAENKNEIISQLTAKGYVAVDTTNDIELKFSKNGKELIIFTVEQDGAYKAVNDGTETKKANLADLLKDLP